MADREPADRELMQRHVDGDPDAFGELVSRHRDRLWAVALRTLRDPDEAADALQDALVSAFRRAGSYRGDAAVTTWLHRIVVNACLDRARRQAVRRAQPLPDDDHHGAAGLSPTPRDAVESVAEDTARRDAVLTALRELAPEQRAALVLVDMEGYSVNEAAQILDCPAGTVKSRCSRGRAQLLPLLGAWAPGAADRAVMEPIPAEGRPNRTASRPSQPEQEVT
ncbi:MAG: RNA polymerase sigma factor SigM [Nocardioidaceae bacterium]|nr:RNA polymerase sigma factor SigM [Nocardioidaceae bacterium]